MTQGDSVLKTGWTRALKTREGTWLVCGSWLGGDGARGTHSGWDEASSPTASRVTSILLTRFPCVLDSVFHVTSLDCKSGFGCWGLTLSVVCGTWITALSVQRSMCNSLEL